MLANLQKLINDPQLCYTETLQELWSGYGTINRYYSPRLGQSVIVKSVAPPQEVEHPRGWHSAVGHQRKLDSYVIEAHFYQHYAHLCTDGCYVPQVIAFSQSKDSSESQDSLESKERVESKGNLENNKNVNSHTQLLVMEDLNHLGFNDNPTSVSLTDIKTVIRWLAHFHARFIGKKAEDLWPVGTYWHLATRQDELLTMQDGPLKQAAAFIDQQLNNASYQTIVHGDAKLANFCFGRFSTDEVANNKYYKIQDDEQNQEHDSNIIQRVAAVDFQYVGRGVGVKDLAYFLGSCLTDAELTQLHNELLDYYFKTLKQACNEYQQALNFSDLEEEWRKLYSFANADFHRFLQGWSPQHAKINNYLQAQSNIALKQINSSTHSINLE